MFFRAGVKCGIQKTNFDNILNMNVEDMSKYLVKIGWSCKNCSEDKRLGETMSQCDEKCELHCKEWLSKEVNSNG